MNTTALAIGMPGWPELVIIAVVALLIFGRRLPDVARSVGKSIVEFKKGIREAKDDLNSTGAASGRSQSQLEPPDAQRLAGSQTTNAPAGQPNEASPQETPTNDSASTK